MLSGYLVAFAILTATEGPPADWPNLRGPEWSGVSGATSLADEWPADGPPVLWSKEIGRGYSSVIAVGESIFTQTQTLYGQYVVCLAADTGEERWRTRYDWPYEAGNIYPGPRATPTYHQGHIYFAAPSGIVGCLDATTGTLRWSRNVMTDFRGRGTNFGYACSPLVMDDRVILPVGGEGASVVALAADTGQTVWQTGNWPASYCPAVPIRFAGQSYLVLHMQNSWALLETASGHTIFEQSFSKGYDEHAALPLFESPWLVFSSPFRGGTQAYELQATVPPSETTARPHSKWFCKKFSNDVCSSIVYRQRIYGFDLADIQSKAERPSRGEFRCLDLATGRICWSTKEVGQSSPIIADGKLILFTDRGELILARADETQYRELARAQIFSGEICWTSPALRGDRIFVRSPTRLACVYLGRPSDLNESLAQAATAASELPQELPIDWLKLAIGGEREFPFDPPDSPELLRWYVASLVGAFLPAVLFSVLAGCCFLGIARDYPRSWRFASHIYWVVLIVLGIVATPVANRLCNTFIFTWPVTLAAVFQLAFLATAWAERQTARRTARWWSRAAGLALVISSAAYFHFCQRCNMSMEWVFLAGMLFSWPLALLAARYLASLRTTAHYCWLLHIAGSLLTFTGLFWSSGLYYLLRFHQTGKWQAW